MKKILLIFALVAFIGCAEEGQQVASEDIDKAAQQTKEGIDKFADKLRNILDNDNGEIDKLKEIVDRVANKSKDLKEVVNENKDEWKAEVERITNDPKFKEKMENIKSEGGDIFKEVEGLLKNIASDLKEINDKN